MFECPNEVSFTKYFDENMEALGLPPPAGLYASSAATIASIVSIAEVVELAGSHVTVIEAAKATTNLELAKISGAILASIYVGAAIGSLAVASGRRLSCGGSIADALLAARSIGVYGTWLEHVYVSNPHLARAAIS